MASLCTTTSHKLCCGQGVPRSRVSPIQNPHRRAHKTHPSPPGLNIQRVCGYLCLALARRHLSEPQGAALQVQTPRLVSLLPCLPDSTASVPVRAFALCCTAPSVNNQREEVGKAIAPWERCDARVRCGVEYGRFSAGALVSVLVAKILTGKEPNFETFSENLSHRAEVQNFVLAALPLQPWAFAEVVRA